MTQSPRIHRIELTDLRLNETSLSNNQWMDVKVFRFKSGAEVDASSNMAGVGLELGPAGLGRPPLKQIYLASN